MAGDLLQAAGHIGLNGCRYQPVVQDDIDDLPSMDGKPGGGKDLALGPLKGIMKVFLRGVLRARALDPSVHTFVFVCNPLGQTLRPEVAQAHLRYQLNSGMEAYWLGWRRIRRCSRMRILRDARNRRNLRPGAFFAFVDPLRSSPWRCDQKGKGVCHILPSKPKLLRRTLLCG